MKHMLKGFFSLALLTSVSVALADSCTNHAYFSIRSQSVNAARELAGWQTHINLFDKDCFYGSFSVTPEFTRSFRSGRIAEFLFGDDLQTINNDEGVLVVSGSRYANRGAKDWLGDYFGLPTDFRSEVTFKPRISNFLVDLNLYLGLDEWACGMYFRIHAPIVHTRWELRATENVTATGANGFEAGYMANVNVPTTSLRHSFLSAVDGSYTFGDMKNPLLYGKIESGVADGSTTSSKSRHSKTRLSDVEAALGWNFWQCEDYHFGLQIRGSAPTGNRPEAEFLFEPMVGNGHHWTLGGGVSAHAVLWRGCDEDRYFGVWMDANISHLFKTKQKRSFDFVGKPNSRYALLAEMSSSVANLYANPTDGDSANSVAPSAQYVNNLLPAINVTTLDVDVSVAVQGDFALKFSYMSCGFEADLGYNLWGRSGEKFKLKNEPALVEKKYVLKGDSHVVGFAGAAVAPLKIDAPIALSASQNSSDIHTGKNFVSGVAADNAQRNPGVDNAQYARLVAGNTGDATLKATIAGVAIDDQTRTSKDPIFVKSTDLDLSKSPSALSHKVFAHIAYNWNDCEDWIPFIGVGGEVEFNGKNNDCYAALSQWGIWLKGGLSFN